MKNLLLLLLTLLGGISLSGQNGSQLYADDEAILIFSNSATDNDIQEILTHFNMTIIDGPSPVTGAVLLKFLPSGAPAWAGNNPIDSINGIIESAQSKSKVDGAGLHYDLLNTSFDFMQSGDDADCNAILDPDTQFNGGYTIDTDIFDTGITNNSSHYGNFFDPTNLGYNYIDASPSPIDDNDHGSHISSIVMKNLDNANNVIDLYAQKTHDQDGTGNLFDIIKAVDDAILAGTDIINMSFSFHAHHSHKLDNYAPLKIAIQNAEAEGILVIASAGNAGLDNDEDALLSISAFPASYPNDNIISVASAGCSKNLSAFSSYGSTSVDVAAPGENVVGIDRKGKLLIVSGTSQATAYTTKLATYLGTYQSTFDWALTKCAILSGTTPLNSTKEILTNGHINSEEALNELLSNPPCSQYGNGNGSGGNKNTYNSEDATLEFNNNSDYIQILSTKKQQADILLTNSMGQVLFVDQLELNEGTWDYDLNVHDINMSGIFFLSVYTAENTYTYKFLR